ncbi:MAG TPA: ABC transporter substrate-binding protein [Gaiellaceae bacterium]|nr:ABC transporter substrate-binding protein [Gaiellaceae bacterium]
MSKLLALLVAAAVAALVAGSGTAATTPHRIVSLSPTATETLYAIGAGDQLLAVDSASDYPKAAVAKKTNLSGFTPNAEAIAGYKPDLVVLSFDSKGIVAALRNLKLRVLLLEPAKDLPDAYAQIQQLGQATGHTAEAAKLVQQMKTRIAALVKSVSRTRGKTYFHEIGPQLYSATSKTFIGKVYTLFGLKNIADAADSSGSGYPQLSSEYVISANPDLIVLADITCCGMTLAKVAARPGWSQLKAVRTYSIVRIDDSIGARWGPRIVNFVKALATALNRL